MVGRDFGQLATASCGIGANCFQWKVAMKELINNSGERGISHHVPVDVTLSLLGYKIFFYSRWDIKNAFSRGNL